MVKKTLVPALEETQNAAAAGGRPSQPPPLRLLERAGGGSKPVEHRDHLTLPHEIGAKEGAGSVTQGRDAPPPLTEAFLPFAGVLHLNGVDRRRGRGLVHRTLIWAFSRPERRTW